MTKIIFYLPCSNSKGRRKVGEASPADADKVAAELMQRHRRELIRESKEV